MLPHEAKGFISYPNNYHYVQSPACPFYTGKSSDYICIKYTSRHYREKCPYGGEKATCDGEVEDEHVIEKPRIPI